MRQRLLWKLLLVNSVPVIALIILVVWLAIDQLAADYFMALMDRYDVPTGETHRMFLEAVHRYLIWASLVALLLAFVLSFLLTHRVLQPLAEMTRVTRAVAAGDFTARTALSSGDEIGQFGATLNLMADRLEQLEQLRKTMVADVAHELRTPLTNLRGYLEGLSDGVLPPEKATLLMLQEEVLRLVHLVDSLQQLAKADAAKAYLQRQELNLPELVAQVVALTRAEFSVRRLEVTTHIAADARTVFADRDKLLQALRNLLDNACKYTPPQGTVAVRGERAGNQIRITIVNSGPGIAADDLPFIFERFYRADRSRSRAGGGAGIGLAIVRQLIEAHGGQVGADSLPGETRVWFTLPA
jgi:signal transduction histidine kinase